MTSLLEMGKEQGCSHFIGLNEAPAHREVLNTRESFFFCHSVLQIVYRAGQIKFHNVSHNFPHRTRVIPELLSR